MAASTWRPPTLRERLSSAVWTGLSAVGVLLLVGFVALVVLGGIALILMLLTGHGFDGIYFVNPADPSTWDQRTDLPTRPAWPWWVAPAVVLPALLIAVGAAAAGSARFGAGTVGDGITGMVVRTTAGEPPSRSRVVLRTGLPILVAAALAAVTGSVLAAAVVALVVLAPVLGPSRASLVDLLIGLRPLVEEEAKLGRPFGSRARSD